MKKHIIGTTALTMALVLSLITSIPASAAQLRASQYLSSYSAFASASGGRITVEYSVFATGIADEVGASQIVIQRKNGSTWTSVKTFNRSSYPALIDEDCLFYLNTVTYDGTSGQQYRAVVTIYAKIGSGSSSYNYTTNTVTA
ncbi:MAG: hypothetical protein LBK75_00850 [Oscillospiraceae bacterium]|jgi:hypothetical protein|nr:hypothetical protein [Oscillospiraceae bacterium]